MHLRKPQADSEQGLSVPLPLWGENTGGNQFDMLANLANVLGVAQPAALQMSASEAPRASAQDYATPLVEWAHNLSGQGTPCAS